VTIDIQTVAKQEMIKMAEGAGLAIELRLLAYLALLALVIWMPYASAVASWK
jgi:cyanate permease